MAEPASPRAILAFGLGFMFLSLLLAYLLVTLWPGNLAHKSGYEIDPIIWFGTSLGFRASIDTRLILLVMVTGALGSFIHTATSFTDFVGNQKLMANWAWWYILRPFIAMALAAIFYVAIRAGFLTGGGQPDTINLFGITALAGMVGMFSKQATDKLSEAFDVLFRTAPTGGDVQRKDSLENPIPTVRSVDPASLTVGSSAAVVRIRGSGFTASSIVRVRDTDRPTVFRDSGELGATLLPADVAAEGELDLVVFTPPPGGGRSVPFSVNVEAAPAAAAQGNLEVVDGTA